jgi:RNA polymerase sigma-70 factor (ECF subfamily)
MDAPFLESIYRQYYKNVYNYTGFRINNHFDAEELASAVFEKAIRKFDTYNASHSPV